MEYFLLLIAWILKTYGAIIEKRAPIDIPLIWQSDTSKTILMLFWIVLLLLSLYMIFNMDGLLMLFISVVFYFFIAPSFLTGPFQKLLVRLGL